jgi:hypothetical protein
MLVPLAAATDGSAIVLAAKANVTEPAMKMFFNMDFFMAITSSGDRYDSSHLTLRNNW